MVHNMQNGYFARVKEAFATDHLRYLETLGVTLSGKSKGGWSSGKCPLCPDKSGSASFTTVGFLKCHQCGKKLDLFDWVAEKDAQTPWDAMTAIAQMVGVDLTPPKRQGKPPRNMEASVLEKAVHGLWSLKEAAPTRAFLKQRNLVNPQLLERFGVGFLAGGLIFAQFSQEDGTLQARYRKYSGGKWAWSSGKGAALGFWPYAEVPKDGTIWILEGEWDVLTAWSVLRLQDQGIYCFTWTGGAGSPIPAHMIPQAWKRKPVHICYDNDTFQGKTWDEHYAPNETDRLAMARRRSNLIHGVASVFDAFHCPTYLRAIPIPAAEKWGADLRDWVDNGGRDIAKIPSFPLNAVKKDRPKPKDCTFDEVFDQEQGSTIRFKASVAAVEEDGIILPGVSSIDCQMGARACCNSCSVPTVYANQMINWEGMQKDLVSALMDRDFEKWITIHVLGKPGSCPRCRVSTVTSSSKCRWTAMSPDSEETSWDKELTVLSDSAPSLSGEIEVEGTFYLVGTRPIIMAHQMRQLDTADIDISDYVTTFTEMCPSDATTVEEIDKYLVKRAHDMSMNVTHIYGREELHIGFDLLAHSVAWIKPDHHKLRGWLDVAFLGDTRAGKSMVARRLLEHYGIGEIHTCMENISRAGLTIGASGGGRKSRLKPGLFPKCHKKMLILDEAHVMVEKSADNPILHLQSARDVGTVGGVKIYGSRTVPAAVRLLAIFNWSGGGQHSREYPASHLLYLYGAPESLSRMDFAVSVDGDPDPTPEPVEHRWDSELTRILALRGWGMTEGMVHFDDGVVALAEQICEDWAGVYSEEMPLFTRKEKPYSILRIATSIANMCFSHPQTKADHCLVRKVHVQWAARWLERTWAMLRYDKLSVRAMATVEVAKPFVVEKMLTTHLHMDDFDNALNLYPHFYESMTRGEIGGVIGKEPYEIDKWISSMLRHGFIAQRAMGNRVGYNLTRGGHTIVQNLVMLAGDFPEEYVRRYRIIDAWSAGHGASDPDLSPLSVKPHILRQEWESRYGDSDGETNIRSGPGS